MSRSQTSFIRFRASGVLWGGAVVAAIVLTMVLFSGAAHATSCNELVSNGDMETSTNWETQTNGDYPLFSDYLVRSGSQAAYLAGVDNAQDSLSRTLTLPDEDEITLSFWWQVHTEERSSGWDGLSVLVADASGTAQKTLFTVSDQEAGYFWSEFTADLSEYSGESIQLQFKAETDGSLATDFFVDDLSVSSCSRSESSLQQIFLPFTRR